LYNVLSLYSTFQKQNWKNDRMTNTFDGFALNSCVDIMYNVDQQLFDYCTAKFADNTQCCTPVFDIRHELPLCMEHAMKAVSITI
jgi:INO80 complex subunit D